MAYKMDLHGPASVLFQLDFQPILQEKEKSNRKSEERGGETQVRRDFSGRKKVKELHLETRNTKQLSGISNSPVD